jgi:hypothetical protein
MANRRNIINKFQKRSVLKENGINEIDYKSLAVAGMIGAASVFPGQAKAAPESPKTVQKVSYPYTLEDIIATTLVDEAGGEKDAARDMQSVLNVIMKRGKGDIRAAAAACLKEKQFSGWNPIKKSDVKSVNGFIETKRKHGKYSVALKLVAQARAGTLKDLTNGADHFLNLELTKSQNGNVPSWYDPKKVTAKIGKTTFLKLT